MKNKDIPFTRPDPSVLYYFPAINDDGQWIQFASLSFCLVLDLSPDHPFSQPLQYPRKSNWSNIPLLRFAW